jgi:hypothetical protein
MSLSLSKTLRNHYRKEPISSFIITVGAVDAVIGGVTQVGSLMIFGLLIAGGALAYRWLITQPPEDKWERDTNHPLLPPSKNPPNF